MNVFKFIASLLPKRNLIEWIPVDNYFPCSLDYMTTENKTFNVFGSCLPSYDNSVLNGGSDIL